MNDVGIELRVKATSEAKYPAAVLVPIKSTPATGQAGDMDYTYNYSETNYNAVKAVCDNTTKDILIKYPDGTGVEYKGICQTWHNEVSVGSVLECTLHTVPSTSPADKTSSEVTALITA